MIEDIKKLLDRYTVWLRDKTHLRDVGNNFVEITTPYLDRHNDYLQIYIRKEDGSYLLTDGGSTIQDLKASGCELETKKRRDLLTQTLSGFGVQLDNDERLLVRATSDNFPLRKHNLVQAILGVNDLFYLSEPLVLSLFVEDVSAWLSSNDIRCTPRVKFTGKTGYDHYFDFVVPASRKRPERLIKAVSKPSKDMVEALAFAWIDTKEVRLENSMLYSFLNDTDKMPAISAIEALRKYDIVPILWSERKAALEELAA